MIGKYIVKLVTKFTLRRNKAIRSSEAYEKAKSIGILYSYNEGKNEKAINKLIERFETDGKSVDTMTFIPKSFKEHGYQLPFFNEKDFSSKGKWKKEEVEIFKTTPFDYLISADWTTDKFTRNILAASRAKCRVGGYEEDNSKYFELMINHSDDNFDSFLGQIHHYIKNMRNND